MCACTSTFRTEVGGPEVMASVLVKGYLLAYNGVMFVGWLQVLCPALCYTATHTNTLARMEGYLPGFYNQMRWPLLVFQTAAVLEVYLLLTFVLLCQQPRVYNLYALNYHGVAPPLD